MRFKKLLPLILCAVFFSGCWDKVEIDRRSFITSIAIDVGKDIGKQEELKSISPDEPFPERRIKKLSITYGFPDISQLGPGKAGTASEKYINTDAYSMEDAVAQGTLKSSRNLYYGHGKLLLLSSDVLNYPDVVREVLDYLERQPTINKMMMVVAVEGKAEEYLKFKPEMEKNVDEYINGLMANSSRAASILPITLKEMFVNLSENGNAIVPWMTFDKTKKELVLSGVAVIKGFALKGFLNPIETGDLEILRGKLKNGKKLVYKEGHPVDFIIEDLDRKIKVNNKNGKLFVNIDIAIEGSIKGYYYGKGVSDTKTIEALEKDISKSLSVELREVVKITQNEFMVDPIGIREYVEKYNPGFWNKIKDNWEETYKNADVNVTVTTHVRRVGVAK